MAYDTTRRNKWVLDGKAPESAGAGPLASDRTDSDLGLAHREIVRMTGRGRRHGHGSSPGDRL